MFKKLLNTLKVLNEDSRVKQYVYIKLLVGKGISVVLFFLTLLKMRLINLKKNKKYLDRRESFLSYIE